MDKPWIEMFGEYFKPSEAKLIRRTSMPIFKDLKAHVVRALVFDIQTEKEDSFGCGFAIGWVACMVMWLLLP